MIVLMIIVCHKSGQLKNKEKTWRKNCPNQQQQQTFDRLSVPVHEVRAEGLPKCPPTVGSVRCCRIPTRKLHYVCLLKTINIALGIIAY